MIPGFLKESDVFNLGSSSLINGVLEPGHKDTTFLRDGVAESLTDTASYSRIPEHLVKVLVFLHI